MSQIAHRPELYGAVTREAVARLEVVPAGKCVYCMAITADGSDRGRPSSWSSAIDEIAMGEDTERTRLVILAAGNTAFQNRTNYPADNETASVQDPAQAWNALTVGAYTEMTTFDQVEYPGHECWRSPAILDPRVPRHWYGPAMLDGHSSPTSSWKAETWRDRVRG